ncbi:hypothetical protein CTEN210_00425 [Chaetoceros tenuissimus]|uniref:Uncharacterized protein n=1 Tax=Chaetoceros tenuissimus TaxID=426638 RepID=A0AAD3GYP2_9STRA|nr:hypothetical protein CTEN210_00425 [Chaetoceros tenuissimus]
MDIATFQGNLDFIKSLYFYEEWKDEVCKKEILAVLEEANEKIVSAFGRSMHRLHKDKPSIEAVEKLVNKFPSTLSHEDESGRLPIHTAVEFCETSGMKGAPEFVPVLAQEGARQNVGGEHARGGLLVVDPTDFFDWNTLQNLCYSDESDPTNMMSRLAALKELRKLGLLVKKDIQEYSLLDKSLFMKGRTIFEYFVDWDPDALVDSRVTTSSGNKPLIHTVLESTRMTILLDAGFKHHPHIAPKHKELFLNKFPWAGSLKDHNGRSLQQAILAAGPELMNENKLLFAMLTDDQIQEKDPVTTLFPFAAMAVGEHADLEKCFYLLRRYPSVMDKRLRANFIVRRRRTKQNINKQKLHETA